MNNEISNTSTQEKFGVSDSLPTQTKQIADKFRERAQKAEREFTENNGVVKLRFFQKQDIEKQVAFDLAKELGLWIDNIHTLGKLFEKGNENTIMLDEIGEVVYKSNNLQNTFGNISTLFETIEVHNQLFPETRYEIAGFTGHENENRTPYVEVVLKQPFVDDAEHTTYQEIADYMQALGFRQVNKHSFETNDYLVSDLHPRNVLKNSEGTIFVVDNRIEIKSDNKEYKIVRI